jgi:FkbM family methyltransferase
MSDMTPVQFIRWAPGAALRRTRSRMRASPLGCVARTSLALAPRQRPAFAWREVRGGDPVGTWLLTDTRLPVTVRCRTRDLDVLREIFVDRAYAAPAEVDEILEPREQPRIVDLGANIGLFGLWALGRWPSALIHSYEPDPDNLAILDRNVADAQVGSRWTITRACAAPANGTVQFVAGQQPDSRVVYGAQPASGTSEVPAVDVFPHLQGADLLKIDIEGAEWPLLTDPRFRELTVPAVVLEYHPYNCPDPARSGETARSLLEGAGYLVVETDRHPLGTGTLWAWRQVGSKPG